MKNVILILTFLVSTINLAQQPTAKGAFLEKWENSKIYLLAIAESMPEEDYSFKPTERQMSFEEQLLHIQSNMEWLGTTYFSKEKTDVSTLKTEKQELIKSLQNSFDAVFQAVENTTESELGETVAFFAGPKSKLQILNLLQDHVSHHRGQLIVYLNLKNIEVPKYTGW